MQVLPKSGHAVHEDVPEQVRHSLYLQLYKPSMTDFTDRFLLCISCTCTLKMLAVLFHFS